MKIVCPSCDAMYEVPDRVVASRRKMRCARCSQDWIPADTIAAQPVAETPAPVSPQPAPPAFGAASQQAQTQIQTAGVDAEADAWPSPGEAKPEPAGTGYVLVDTPPQSEPADEDAHADARRDDEPYQLALRPETHINVFADRQTGTPFGSASPLAARPVVQGAPVLAWFVSVVVLVVFLAGLLLLRGAVMKIWPPSERLYTAMGLVQQ